ncbi:ABC transporter ATP-binding protein [Metallosphaera sedula]|uniref:ABC transporter ATP-binding protein n=1 Tax=Metallosphaera sedula TaxID=43687 RepID=UPI0020C028FC|nr:ABC transporter ATP-binding protein [Metallosphaera sedula]BBL46868.1 molybdate/tungstate import ATP-binding protein WtpC [Metallosphaera sedula]
MLELSGIEVTYPGRDGPALRIPRLEVRRGEIVFVTGRTGSGKSTLLNLLNGVIPRVIEAEIKGEIRIEGKGIRPGDDPPIVIGTLFQDPDAQLINEYVEDEIGFGLENLGYPPEEVEIRVKEIAESLKISHLLHRETRKLSLGEKQVVVLASILAMKPELLVLDEPTSNLDPWETKLILRYIRELGITTIVAEHKPVFRSIATRVINLVDGTPMEQEVRIEYPPRPASRVEDRIKLSAEILVRDGERVILNTKLKLGPGITTLLGRNGSGKTTLLRGIVGLLPGNLNFEGCVQVNGVDVLRLTPSKRGRIIGYLPQDIQLIFSRSTVAKELELCLRGGDPEPLLRRFGLERFKDEDPFMLSTGQARRLAIACLMGRGVEIILLDEPTTGQDVESRIQIGEELRALERTILLTTHDPRFTEAFADEVLLLENGEVRKVGLGEIRDINSGPSG